MPFYEYRCIACGHDESFLESINAAKVKTCPQCGKARGMKRLISAAGFQLKGQGWYVTDFKNKDKPKPAKTAKTDAKEEKKAGTADQADKTGTSESAAKTETATVDKKKTDNQPKKKD